jgi:hypothetical protein
MNDDDEPDDDQLSETEQGVYSNWVNYDGISLRFCRTNDRINWQFANNTYSQVTTWGSSISAMTSWIAGQSSGSKYRTRNGATWFA